LTNFIAGIDYNTLNTYFGDMWGYLVVSNQSYTAPVMVGFGINHQSSSVSGYFSLLSEYLLNIDYDWNYDSIDGTDANGNVYPYGILDTTWESISYQPLVNALQTLEVKSQGPTAPFTSSIEPTAITQNGNQVTDTAISSPTQHSNLVPIVIGVVIGVLALLIIIGLVALFIWYKLSSRGPVSVGPTAMDLMVDTTATEYKSMPAKRTTSKRAPTTPVKPASIIVNVSKSPPSYIDLNELKLEKVLGEG
jgi:hypothetical protein